MKAERLQPACTGSSESRIDRLHELAPISFIHHSPLSFSSLLGSCCPSRLLKHQHSMVFHEQAPLTAIPGYPDVAQRIALKTA